MLERYNLVEVQKHSRSDTYFVKILEPISKDDGHKILINLMPYGFKICTSNCIFCQSGGTKLLTINRRKFIDSDLILEELDKAINKVKIIDYATLMGHGEHLLISNFGDILRSVKNMVNCPVAVLTNGNLLYMEQVRKELLHADIVIPSLVSTNQETFQNITRPASGMEIEKIIQGLVSFRKEFKGLIILELIFLKGLNDSKEELKGIKEAVEKIEPDKIVLNTVLRPPAEEYALRVDKKQLEEIKDFISWENTEILND